MGNGTQLSNNFGILFLLVWWYISVMGVCVMEKFLYANLFIGTLLFYPALAWCWFYLCWILSCGGIVLQILVLIKFKDVHLLECACSLFSLTVVVFYEMWLWLFSAKRIKHFANTYYAEKDLQIPEKAHPEEAQPTKPKWWRRGRINPLIHDTLSHPIVIYDGWDDNSYSLADEYIRTHSKHNDFPSKHFSYTEFPNRKTVMNKEELIDQIAKNILDPKIT